jgi:hypothetical protein
MSVRATRVAHAPLRAASPLMAAHGSSKDSAKIAQETLVESLVSANITRELMKKHRDKPTDELRPEYDLRQLLKGAVRGKYAKRFHAGTSFVRLGRDPRKAAL